MVENLGRKVTLIFSLLAVAVLALVIGRFRLGLDLSGGTRLVYSVDLEKAAESGQITQQELADPEALFDQMRRIWDERLDPSGVRNPTIRREGTDRIVIELPGSAAQLRRTVTVPLAEEIGPGALELTLGGTEDDWQAFPVNGGQIEIGDERVRYAKRVLNVLRGLERNYGGESVPSAHEAQSEVRLVALDPWRELIENVGSMAFFIEANRLDLGPGADLQALIEEARQWVRDNPDSPISEYNNTIARRPGAVGRLRFYPMAVQSREQLQSDRAELLQALILEENENWRFTGADVEAVYPSNDNLGLPAVGFEMKTYARERFLAFTEEHEDERMAIVINDEIVTFPNIDEPLPGQGIIRGQFTANEVQELVTVLRSGSLRLKPKFEAQESVGATLGQDYVTKGFLGVGLGLVLVLGFMMVYYRRLGVFAAISMLCNLILLMGAMAFFQATLTLPGVAGIILTVGMAVDANILIYERIREEALRGRKPLQSAKDGFANALSTIVDANVTTLITGLILYRFGTGPVRGFATTLCVGILTTMFAALVVTRVLLHLQLERGIERFRMGQLVHDTKIRFLAKARPAVAASLVAIVAGVAFYASLSEEEKLGIDFLGGMTMTVRLADPHDVEEVRALVAGIGGTIGTSAEVKEILNSGVDGGYTRFRITAKGSALEMGPAADAARAAGPESDPAGGDAAEGAEREDVLQEFRAEVEAALASVIQKGPIEDLAVAGGEASGTLYLEREHPTEDIAAELQRLGVDDPTVTATEGRGVWMYGFQGAVGATKTRAGLERQISDAFQNAADSRGVTMALASPVDEVSAVGAQVVSELRDKAIFAILLSIFAAVMYIRVRFAEYSFGLAAVVAVAHDVLVTLGALAVADRFLPVIDAEINLPMIAAFLTIIGYSLNDTIVIFDRVRENLPRMKGTLAEIIDRSINQTLSRTLLTSGTTAISVLLLLVFNLGTGNVLEGFSFAMLVGIVAGTYSTIFIACPVLLWLETRRQRHLDDDDPTRKGSQVEAAVPAPAA